jgi:hypothetical protein
VDAVQKYNDTKDTKSVMFVAAAPRHDLNKNQALMHVAATERVTDKSLLAPIWLNWKRWQTSSRRCGLTTKT